MLPKEITEKFKEEVKRLREIKEAEKSKLRGEAASQIRSTKGAAKIVLPDSLNEYSKIHYKPGSDANKLTWEGLEKISYRQLKGKDSFNPANLVETDEQEQNPEEDEEFAQIFRKLRGKSESDNCVANHLGKKVVVNRYSNRGGSIKVKR